MKTKSLKKQLKQLRRDLKARIARHKLVGAGDNVYRMPEADLDAFAKRVCRATVRYHRAAIAKREVKDEALHISAQEAIYDLFRVREEEARKAAERHRNARKALNLLPVYDPTPGVMNCWWQGAPVTEDEYHQLNPMHPLVPDYIEEVSPTLQEMWVAAGDPWFDTAPDEESSAVPGFPNPRWMGILQDRIDDADKQTSAPQEDFVPINTKSSFEEVIEAVNKANGFEPCNSKPCPDA